jgi:predicted ATPase/transcriptional regulator with XRE-family HTH domain
MPDAELFSVWLKRRRKSLDLTREVLGQRAHCSASTIRRLEADDLRPSRQLAESLAAALDMPTEQWEAFAQFARGGAPAASLLAFPGLSSRPSQPTLRPAQLANLPAPLTSFVGRKREAAALCALLREPGVRLLTLTGPPGTGKTRLSLAVARQLAESGEFSDGMYFVPLAPVHDPALVMVTIAQALGLREAPGKTFQQIVQDFLRPKNALLVLDNFEQVVEAAPRVAELISAAPGVKALITSRAVLHVYGEHEFPVPPLELPDVRRLPTTNAYAYLGHYSSVQLFKERARAAKPDFKLTPENAADVVRICAWLDGLPLAIEMAAAQVKWQPVDRLLGQLNDRLAVLTDGPRDLSPRQQSLEGAIDWSYNLLNEGERRLFRLLGAFEGGCDAQAVQAIAEELGLAVGPDPASALQALVEKSLLRYISSPTGQARYEMLETLRDYACEKLRLSGELARARQAHAGYYHHLAQAAQPVLTFGGDQKAWLERLELEQYNLRLALQWASAAPERAAFYLQLVEGLYPFWFTRGYLSEGWRWLEKALALASAPSELRARVLNYTGQIARLQGDFSASQDYHTQALEMQRTIRDEPGICRSLESLAIIAGSQGDYQQARELLGQTLALRRKLGDQRTVLSTLNNLAIVARRLGDLEQSERLYHEASELSQAMNDQRSLSHALQGLGEVHVERGDPAAGLAYFRECIAIRYQLGNRPELAHALYAAGRAFYHLRDGDNAARLIAASEKLRQEIGAGTSEAYRAEAEADIAQVRALLGEAAFAQAWAEGQAMSTEKMVQLVEATVRKTF